MPQWGPPSVTKPYLQTIFKNVSFPTANWSNWTLPKNAEPGDVMLFNNSRTGLRELECGLSFNRAEMEGFSLV